jgi:hypothetical protein
MRTHFKPLAWLPLLLVLSCAAPSELVRRSEVSLQQGDAMKAFDWARRALDKEPGNAHARDAMTRAGRVLMEDAKARMLNLAEVDTIGAAKQSIELDAFRAQLNRYRVILPHDGAFEANEAQIRSGAAGAYYNMGARSLAGHRPRQAYREFTECQQFSPDYRDVAARMDRAYALAVTRVAILPFNNEVAISALSPQMMEETYSQVVRLNNIRSLPFTRLISPDQIYGKLTMADAVHMSRAAAIKVGRALGAQRIVIGRYYALRAETNNDTYHETIFHKVPGVKNAEGPTRDRFEEQRFEAVRRERTITVSFEFEVIDIDEETPLAHRGDDRSVVARTVYTRFQPSGNCDDYCLVPPDAKAADPDRAKGVEGEWKEKFGSLTLPKFLDRAAKSSGRTRYESRFRGEFVHASDPVYLDDLPPEGDLAFIALSDLWEPLAATLRDLDGRDTVDLRGIADGD